MACADTENPFTDDNGGGDNPFTSDKHQQPVAEAVSSIPAAAATTSVGGIGDDTLGWEKEDWQKEQQQQDPNQQQVLTEGEHGPHVHHHDPSPHLIPRKLGTLPLAVMIFYSVSGGPFGSEETIRAGGNFATLIGFLVMPFVWSAQEALMTAELGAAFPEASGGVAWVEEAWGKNLAWMTGWLGYVAGTTDNAIYPVLFLEYLLQILGEEEAAEVHPVLRFFVLGAICSGLAVLNWRGLNIVGHLLIFVAIIAMSPFLILVIAGIPNIDTSRWYERANPDTDAVVAATNADITGGFFPYATLGGVLLRPFLNSLFWNLNSFNNAGSFAADIDDPGRILPRSMLYAFFMVVLGYLIPLSVILGASDAKQTDWSDGYFARVARDLVGPWLGVWMVGASGISNIALFQAELSTESFQLMGMSERGHVPKVFSMRSRYQTPTAAILLSTVFMIGMSVANFEQLVELLNFNYAFGLLIEFTAFLKLRYSEPLLHRPFRVPLPLWACCLFMIPTFVAILTVMLLSKYSTMAFSILVNLVGGVVYIFCRPGVLSSILERFGHKHSSGTLEMGGSAVKNAASSPKRSGSPAETIPDEDIYMSDHQNEGGDKKADSLI